MTHRKKNKKKPFLKHKVTHHLKTSLLQYVKGKNYRPASFQELVVTLDVSSAHTQQFKKVVESLVQEKILLLNGKTYIKSNTAPLVQGTISVHPKGFGFVKVEGMGSDVFIPKPGMNQAIDGDLVEIEVNPVVSVKGPEGTVVSILKRSKTHLAMTVLTQENQHWSAFSPLFGMEKTILVKSAVPLIPGDRIICKVLNWDTQEKQIEAVLEKKMGHISDASIDVDAAIEEFNLPKSFSHEAIEEAKSFGNKVVFRPAEGREDLTDLDCITIDPDTARDFDDAISLSVDEQGCFHLGVHIADVAQYVRPNTCLDQEAQLRCNSTYFPGKCLPMLPEELSNELCSLKPKVNRLTQSVLAEFDSLGNLKQYRIVRSMIRSRKRLTYKEAFKILEEDKEHEFFPLLNRMVSLCHLFKQKRKDRGSIDFSLPDDVILVNKEGVPTRIERIEYDITHQMIEEFMLKANEMVAEHLSQKGVSVIYRVHEEPTPESVKDFHTFARSLGYYLPPNPAHHDIQKLFQEAKGSPFQEQLSVSFIRSMKLAFYSPENLGHYGLALHYYCHFTSPIRRYTDLIIQRLLFQEIPPDYDISKVAIACSEKERISFRAESSVVILKKLRLAHTELDRDPQKIYSAILTRIKPFVLFFEVAAFDLEGSFHISELGDDFYEYNPKAMSFTGTRTGKKFVLGQTLFVRLEKVNFLLRQASWVIAKDPTLLKSHKKKRTSSN